MLGALVVCLDSRTRGEHVKSFLPAFFISSLLGLMLSHKHGGKFQVNVCLDTQSDWISSWRSVKTTLLRGDMEVREVDRVTGGRSHAVLVVG